MQTEAFTAAQKALDNLFKAAALANILGFALTATEENSPDITGGSQVAFDIRNLLNEAAEELTDVKSHLQGWQRRES